MKLPTFSLNIFKKPNKKKRIITTFGKRGSTASSSTPRKSRRSSSNRKSRKRSITYYAPSKSKFYPIEHFPSLQRAVRRASLIATTPLAPRSYQQIEDRQTVSTDVEPKLNAYPSANGTLRSYAPKQTYLCDNEYGDIILHQPPAWYMQSKPHQDCYQTEIHPNDLRGPNTISMQNKPFSTGSVDPNGNLLYGDNNRLNNTYASTYSKECIQGVPISSMVNAIPLNDSNIKYDMTELHRQSQHNLLPSSVTTAYNNTIFNSANSVHSKNNIHNFCTAYQTNSNQLITNPQSMGLSMYSATLPSKKKPDRQRHRKVRPNNHNKQNNQQHRIRPNFQVPNYNLSCNWNFSP